MNVNWIFYTPRAARYPLAERLIESGLAAELIKVKNAEEADAILEESADPAAEGKKSLLLDTFAGDFFKPCPCTPGYVTCNYKILSPVVGCPFDCSYCILQDYLEHLPIIVYVNLEDMFSQLERLIRPGSKDPLRVGTGELADSLALEPGLGIAGEMVSFFADQKRFTFELKTKSDNIQCLENLNHKGRTVAAWSLNPQSVIEREESGCASLVKRIEAAKTAALWGYKVAFHFDPVIDGPDAEQEYPEVAEMIFNYVKPDDIAWISLGALRFPPSLADTIRRRFPQSRVLLGELFRGRDGKLRYLRPRREKLFKMLADKITEHAPQATLYLCMESDTVWKRALSRSPAKTLQRLIRVPACPSGTVI